MANILEAIQGVKSYSAPPHGGAWEPFLSLERSQAERQSSYPSGSPFILAGLGRLRLYIINPYHPLYEASPRLSQEVRVKGSALPNTKTLIKISWWRKWSGA
ncbi:hypothetical protein EPUL_005179, partial [Erysiphe pulchra]